MIYCPQTRRTYRSAREAAQLLGLIESDVRSVVKGKFRQTRSYTFYEREAEPKKRKPQIRPDLRVKIKCVETGRTFASIKSAAKHVGVKYHQMYVAIRKGTRVDGCTFRYADFEMLEKSAPIALTDDERAAKFAEQQKPVAARLPPQPRQITKRRAPVVDNHTGRKFVSIIQAASATGETPDAILASCNAATRDGTRFRFTTPLPRNKPIRCEQTRIVYPTYSAAARALNIPQPHISRHMIGELRHVKGYTFVPADAPPHNDLFGAL